jgi:hypothetical protein
VGEKRSGAGHTRLYKLRAKMTTAAVTCAGYEGMKRGSTVVIPGLWNKLIAFAGELPPLRIARGSQSLAAGAALVTRVALLELAGRL